MAKIKDRAALPTVDKSEEIEQVEQQQIQTEPEQLPLVSKLIEVPIVDPSIPQVQEFNGRIDITGVTHRQMVALRRLQTALLAKGEILDSGYPIQNRGRAIKWLLEQIAKD